jgi:NRPS condensation-like uncharacterized protein
MSRIAWKKGLLKMIIENKLSIIKNLPPDKRKAFYQKLQQLSDRKSTTQQLHRYPRDNRIPLSAIQEQIWFYEQLVSGSNAYNVPMAMHLTGYIDIGALKKVVNDILSRNEILRTYFKEIDGRPYQFILDELEFDIQIIDIEDDDRSDKVGYAKEIASDLSRQHFDLSQCPLFRVALIKISENDHVLVFVIHHLLCDNWSLRLLINSVIKLYNAYANGEPAQPANTGIQYADYCYWEQELINSPEFEKQSEYLKQKLDGKINELHLPFDRRRESWEKRKSKSQRFYIDSSCYERMKAFCKEYNVTTYNILFSVYTALLYRYTNDNDIIIGTSFVNRPDVDSEYVLGPFINILLVCTGFYEGITFKDLISQVKEIILNYHAHKHIPMYKIIKELKIKRSANALSLFQVFFDFLNFNMEDWSVKPPDNIEVDFMIHYDILVNHNTPKFDLDLTMAESNEGIGGNMEYACDVFDCSTISQMIVHFKIILDALLDNPGIKVSDIPLFNRQNETLLKYENMVDFNF